MTIDETDTVLTLWTATLPPTGRPGDWLCIVAVTAGGKLKGEYRFRYHNGPGFEDGDEISHYAIDMAMDSPEARQRIADGVRKVLAHGDFRDVLESPVNGSHKKLFDVLTALPGWATQVTRPEAATR